MELQLISAVAGLFGTIALWIALDRMLTAMRCGVYSNGNDVISNAVVKGYCWYKAFARIGLLLFIVSYAAQIWTLAGESIVAVIKEQVASW